MNGRIAKQIRRDVYGPMSPRERTTERGKDLRRIYQSVKKQYYADQRL